MKWKLFSLNAFTNIWGLYCAPQLPTPTSLKRGFSYFPVSQCPPLCLGRRSACLKGCWRNPWRVPILLVNRCCSYKVFQNFFSQHLLHPISPARNHKTRTSDFWMASNFSGLLNSCLRFQGALAEWVNLIPFNRTCEHT